MHDFNRMSLETVAKLFELLKQSRMLGFDLSSKRGRPIGRVTDRGGDFGVGSFASQKLYQPLCDADAQLPSFALSDELRQRGFELGQARLSQSFGITGQLRRKRVLSGDGKQGICADAQNTIELLADELRDLAALRV